MPLVYIYGDSLTKYMSSGLSEKSFGLYTPIVNAQRGYTILDMTKLLKKETVPALHVGTNSLSQSAILTKFIREYRDLVCAARAQFPKAHIIISELTPRTQFDISTYNHALCSMARDVCNVSYARHDVQMHDLNYDGIHLRRGGYATFLQCMHSTISCTINRCKYDYPTHYPSTMVPPLVRLKSQKEKKKEEEEKIKNISDNEVSSNSDPSRKCKARGNNRVSSSRKVIKKMRKSVTPVLGSDFFKVGWMVPAENRVLPPQRTVGTISCQQAKPLKTPRASTAPSSGPSPYVTRRLKAQKRKRKKGRIKKRRSRRRRKQVCIFIFE